MVRLYERYAELLPEGSARTRAGTIARSVTAQLGPLDLHRLTAVMAPAVEFVDRRIVGVGRLYGAEEFRAAVRTLFEAAEDVANSADDVLALHADALLLRVINSGTDRAGGGPYERPILALIAFGANGLSTHVEFFEPEHEAEALARFDELTAAPPARPARCRVRPNAATAHAARLDAAIAAQDADAVPALVSAEMEALDHLTHTTWDRPAVVSSWRSLARAEEPSCRHEPLATLGESLALCRMSLTARRLARGSFDVGGYEKTEIHLIEVDAQGQRRWTEVFAVEKLADAVVRLYERHAELLPECPARTRAAAIARVVAVWNGPLDLDRLTTSFAPSVESVDHRILGTRSMQGVEQSLQHWRAQLDVADVDVRDHEVLALEPDAFLVRRTWFGIERVSGAAYENLTLQLFTFRADGLTRAEVFDAEREAEALARFDELTNAATRAIDAIGASAPGDPLAAGPRDGAHRSK